MRKILFLFMVVFIAGCTGKVAHITPSGQVEVTVVRPFTSEVSGMLQSRMEERGYELIVVKGNDLAFRRLTKEGMVAFLDGVGMDMPEARIIYHVSPKEHSFNLIASFALVKNSGRYDESIRFVNDHGDTVKYQKMLNEFKADVESLPQPEIVVAESSEMIPVSESGVEVYEDYFRDAAKKKEKSLYEKIKTLPASNYKANLKGYKELYKMDPKNELYRTKIEYYSAKVREEYCRTSGECTELYAKVKKMPASDYEANLNGYRELLAQYPKNKKFKRKVDFYSQKIADGEKRNSCDIEVAGWGWHYSESRRYIIAEGQVENLTGRRLERVKFVVTYSDKNDTFVTSGMGYVEFKPLMPGQKSPFKAYTSYNPVIEYARIELFDDRGNKMDTYFQNK